MRYLIFSASLVYLLASCGASCDTSTPEGAADCACGYGDEYKAAFDSKDEAKMKEIDTKMQTWENEVEKHMEAGDYTENEVEAALMSKNCNM